MLSITNPQFQSLKVLRPNGRYVNLLPGVTNIQDKAEVDYILSHPHIDLLESTGRIQINGAVRGTNGGIFELVDQATGDGLPVGDLVPDGKGGSKTEYRGEAIKDKEAVKEDVKKKTARRPSKKAAEAAEAAE